MVLAHKVNEGERTQDIRINQDVTFETMLLTFNTLQGLKDSGFYKPSPIQLHGIPLGKCGFDLLLEAKSGTGKTAVFSIIALEKIRLNKGLQVVILAPTREIAMQISDVIKQIGARHKGLCVEVVMGGLPLIEDINKFKNNVHIVVGSPGRLKHLIQDKYVDTAAVRLLILDEADKLMEKSFQSDINFIHLNLPKQKQIIMSSATYPEGCKSIISKFVQNAQHICPDSNNVLLGIEQRVTLVKYNSNIIIQTRLKLTELLKILANRQFKQCLIFCNYQARVSELYKKLTKEKWPVQQLYGQQHQVDRLDALKTLQEYKCRLLISTDLAARGIDASNVDLVINFEPPFDWQTYLHRIGRAGRFGSYGVAVTILSEGSEQNEFKGLLECIKLPFQLTDLWSNSEFCIKNNITNVCLAPQYQRYELNNENMTTQTIHNNNLKLWNALTGNFNLVDNLSETCKSLTEPATHDSLESFNDLLKSFENNSNTNCTNSKMCLTDTTEFSHKDNILQNSSETGNCRSDFKIKEIQNNNKLETIESGPQIDKQCDLESPSKTCVNDNLFASDLNMEYERKQTLAELELPKAFSSSKHLNLHKKYFKYKKSHNLNNTHCKTNYKGDDQLNHFNGKKMYLKSNNIKTFKINNKSNNQIDRHEIKSSPRCDSCAIYYEDIPNISKNGTKVSQYYCKYYNLHKDVPSAGNCNQTYTEWYNSLKAHVKQVELIMYFNEFRKIQLQKM